MESVPTNRRERWLHGLLLYVLAAAAYLPALRDGWIWDDDHHVTANMALRSWGGLARIWFVVRTVPQYYPLTHTVFWLEYRLWGLHPSGYHLVNILFQGANAVLLWRLLGALELPGAFFAAAVFAVHPLQAESVLWITELKNLLSGFFVFAAALAYLRWEAGDRRSQRPYALAAGLYLAALLSKTTACVLPAALLLIFWWKRGRLERRDVLPLLPLFAAGLLLGFTTSLIERFGVGARGPEWAFSPAQRLLIAGRAPWFYAGKLLWPWPLTFVYPRWTLDAFSAAQWLWPLAAALALAALWAYRGRLGRGPLAAALGFCAALFPALGFVNLYPMRYTFVADHYAYLACAFAFAAACAAAASAAARLGRLGRAAAPWLAAAVLLACGAVDWSRASVFRNSETLWRDTLSKNPDSWMVRYNLGLAYAGEGRWDEAITMIRRTLKLTPLSPEILNTLGNAFAAKGELWSAVAQYRQAISLRSEYPEAHSDLGAAYVALGHRDAAEQEFDEALREDPSFQPARMNLVLCMEKDGRFEDARFQLRRALEFDPDFVPALLELGDIDLEHGSAEAAAAEFEEAVRRDPGSAQAHYNLGCAYSRLKRLPDAAREYQEALRREPGFREAAINLHNALKALGAAAAP